VRSTWHHVSSVTSFRKQNPKNEKQVDHDGMKFLVLCTFLLQTFGSAWLTTHQILRQRSSCLHSTSSNDENMPKIVLIIGACGLDRLLAVPSYPSPDDKIRTSAYHEIGGGNAANTATAMALLASSSFLSLQIQIQLATKVGDDYIGKQLIQELKNSGVDLSSPLFQVGAKGTTTGFTSVIVSEREHTRTCIHTPGTCGELTMRDVQDLDLDQVFENVIHLHSDARHTDLALYLAQQARKRGITVSLDVEKDRQSKSLDRLLEVVTHLFTNSQQIDSYLARLNHDMEEEQDRYRLKEANVVGKAASSLTDADLDFYAYSIRPSAFFTRWYEQKGKEVVITKGHRGALHIRCDAIAQYPASDSDRSSCCNQIEIVVDKEVVRVRHELTDQSKDQSVARVTAADYSIHKTGVLTDVEIVDTTGAGDAFIGAYLLSMLCQNSIEMSLAFGCWVGGRKLAGPGARSALPTASDVDRTLGANVREVEQTLKQILTPFRSPSDLGASAGEAWETVER